MAGFHNNITGTWLIALITLLDGSEFYFVVEQVPLYIG